MRGMSGLCLLALFSVGMLVGCDKTYKITVTNTSPAVRDVEMKDPNGFHRLGTVASGQSIRYTLKVSEDELPAACEIRAGQMAKPFTLDKKDKDNQYFYLEENGIVGPLDVNKEVRHSTRFEGKSSRTGGEVITGDGAPAPAQGGRIIEQREVVD